MNTKQPAARAQFIPGLDQCLALLRAGQLDRFEVAARELAARHPQASKPIQLVGVAALMKGRLQQAIDALQQAARLNPDDASIWDNLGVALQRAGHRLAAVDCFQGSVRLDPNVAAVWVNAAANFADLGDFVLARNCAARAVQLDSSLVEAHLNLGQALRHLNEPVPAIRALLAATDLDADCAPAHMGLALALKANHKNELALRHARRALEIDPEYLDGRLAHAIVCQRAREAVDALREVRRLEPDNLVSAQGLLWNSLLDDRISPEELFALHDEFGRYFEPRFAPLRKSHANAREPERKLKIGFLSGDLRRHPVADHVLPLWQGLGRYNIAIHAYHSHSFNDEATTQLRALADMWADVHELGDDDLAQRIRDDGIDILVDLAGHTSYNRMAVLLRKPAPLQMHWIGYPSSTGVRAIDYYIADPVFAPAGMADALCSEKLLRLPTYNNQCSLPDTPGTPSALPALRNGCITFGWTGRADKLNPSVLALWGRVLQAVPGSRILIGDASITDFRERVLAGLAAAGIDGARVGFRDRGDESVFAGLHRDIDIVLDTFPFNGGTSLTHGLYFGVPTVTVAGRALTQRMGAARLEVVGLGDWVAQDADAYVDIACRKAADLEALAALRADLPRRLDAAPLRDIDRFAATFSSGLRTAWQRWCRGEAPAAIDVAAE